MEFWKSLEDELTNGHRAVLLYVIHSEGSSPGRQGFKMWVSTSGQMLGSIGGGIMEHKWVNQCKKKYLHLDFSPFLKQQVHRKEEFTNASGLICSGEQTIAFYSITPNHLELIQQIHKSIESKSFGVLHLNHNGLEFHPDRKLTSKFHLEQHHSTQFSLQEDIGFAPQLYIAGGGHVSLALTQMAHWLGFEVHVLDNRKDLNTVERNTWAKHHFVEDYQAIHQEIPAGDNTYVVLMSFGYQTDKTILKSVLQKNYTYLGMMGSQEKVKKLFAELEEEGYSKSQLANVHAPIGLPIFSRTPEEISVSILAEIIKVKNLNS
jgi:xanthine dehydrogenase accessory factor